MTDQVFVSAMYAEFPFLSNYLRRLNASRGAVEYWSEETLDLGYNHGSLYLVDASGNKITDVKHVNVGQTLGEMGEKAKQVYFLVCVSGGSQVWLYRIPKPYKNAAEWLASLTQKHREQLRNL